MRRTWMDTLKWTTILWVVAFHIACMFNCCGMSLGVAPGLPASDLVGYFAYPWIMPLMFLLAGMGARYALEVRSRRAFLRDRARRLLLPLLGVLVFVAPALCAFTWWSVGTSFDQMAQVLPLPVVVLIGLLCGMGPQWFLLFLFLFSLLLLPFCRRVPRRDWGWPGLAAAGAIYGLATWLMPVPDRYPAYLVSFLAGYFLCAAPAVLKRLERARLPLLAAALGSFALAAARHWGDSFAGPPFLTDPAVLVFGWTFCLAALGWGQVLPQRPHPFWESRSFTIYLFHYLPMLAVAWCSSHWGWPAAARYAAALAAALAVPLVLHELLIRIPPLKALFALRDG